MPTPITTDNLSVDSETGQAESAVTQEQYKKAKEDFESAKKELQEKFHSLSNDKVSLITVLGIFVSVFTFISIEIQILRYICDFYKIVGLTLIIPGVLMLFNCSLDYIARSWIRQNSKELSPVIIVLVISILLILGGLFMVSKSNQDWMCKQENSNYQIIPIEKSVSNEMKLPNSINIRLTQ